MKSQPLSATSLTSVPPGLTCDQYYLYLASGYTYSFNHNIMYRSEQVASEQQLSTLVNHHVLDRKEIAHLLANGQYFDFEQQKWTSALFTNKPEKIRERIWHEALDPRDTFPRIQQKNIDLMSMMASMSLKPHESPTKVKKRMYVKILPKPAACKTTNDKVFKGDENAAKDGLRKVQAQPVGSKHKSRRAHPVKEKVRTLPSSLALSPEFWKIVL